MFDIKRERMIQKYSKRFSVDLLRSPTMGYSSRIQHLDGVFLSWQRSSQASRNFNLRRWASPALSIPTLLTTAVGFLTVSFIFTDRFHIDNPLTASYCTFFAESSSALITFFYVPIGVLLLLDIYFFLSLMFNANLMHCWQRQQDVAIRSNRKSSSESKEQEE
jgi:hypothetical protein